MKGTRIEFIKPEHGRRYRSLLHRRDGVVVELEGGSYNKVGGAARELPHDLAHFVVEDGLGLESGLWGTLAAGGLIGQTRIVAGRQAPHAAAKGKARVKAAHEQLMQCEVLTGAVCDLAASGASGPVRRDGERWWEASIGDDAVRATARELHAMSERWRDLAPGGTLEIEWRLPVPRG